MADPNHKIFERFYSLDVLRGIAALSVVFWHWQHFFYTGTNLGAFDVTKLPLFDGLSMLYKQGWLAIDLFFSLSGFIFYWLYSKRVAEGSISPGKFALLRFSRLYPLHVATLLFVALSQVWLLHANGSYFAYPNNDLKHFLLNLVFASSWGFESSRTFNGPIWSVSVEVLLYVLFFLCCRRLPIRALVLALLSMAGFFVVKKFYFPIGQGIGSFFLGGLMFLLYQKLTASRYADSATKWSAFLMIGSWTATLVVLLCKYDITSLSLRSLPVLHHFEPCFHWIVDTLASTWWPEIALFPLTILSLALIENRRGHLGKRFAFLGDISYSTYLLHFPLQLIISVGFARIAISNSIYYTPWFMGAFFAVLIGLSLASYRYLEMPAQRYLRGKGQNHSFRPKPLAPSS